MEEITDIETPNSVVYEDEGDEARDVGGSRPQTGLWNTKGDEELEGPTSLSPSVSTAGTSEGLSEEDTRILLEKEFDDYYEDRIHKSAGPVVFLSKCLGMLPLIWTDDETGSECKSYFNMYTFIIFLGWIGVAVLTGTRIDKVSSWPADGMFTAANASDHQRFFSRTTMDTYAAAVFGNCLVAIIFGVFKSRMFAEVLFTAAEVDSQLELKEKHYDKIKSKSLFWVVVEISLFAIHGIALYFFLEDLGQDYVLFGCFLLGHLAIGVLDLQYIHMCMVLCKRYRMLNKIIAHIIKPFKTFRAEEPTNEMLQKILSYRWEAVKKEEARNTFDQIWEPSEKDNPSVDLESLTASPAKKPDFKQTLSLSTIPELEKKPDFNQEVPAAIWLKGGEKEISREEESTVILQLDILRGIHSDLHNVGQEINSLLGFQMLVNLISNVVIIIMFGFYFSSTTYDGKCYWPFAVLLFSPVFRVLFIGHWAQVMKDTSMKPFWTMSQMSTLDGSPKLERQVQKFSLQASQKTARVTAAGYFYITRGTISKILGLIALMVFLLVKFDRMERTSILMA